MKVVDAPQNGPVWLSRSRALRRSDQPPPAWHRFSGSLNHWMRLGLTLLPLRLRNPFADWLDRLYSSPAALHTASGPVHQFSAANTTTTPLWAQLGVLVVLAGLWYGVQRTVSFPLAVTVPDSETTLTAAPRTNEAAPLALSPVNEVTAQPAEGLATERMSSVSDERGASLTSAKTIWISGKDFAKSVRTNALTVQEVLDEIGVTLGTLDRVEPALMAPLAEATDIRVIRVRQSQEHKQEAVPFEYVRRDDPTLPLGLWRHMQTGSPGTLLQRIETFTEDGEVVSRKVAEGQLVEAPRADVTVYGTRRLSGPLASLQDAKRLLPGYGAVAAKDTLAVRRVLRVVATGYDAGPGSTGKDEGSRGYGITSIGWQARPGIIAVDPRTIPLGTRMYVPGYGFGVAGDTGGAIVGHRIDLFYDSVHEAMRWGRRTVPVYILE